ncbi:hypothetical protein ACL02T_26455 [Pseudonocardia sp. RS010]|uniref:hypothetical protein n=1 Tax=Pseudonocardia sp. RS010 TaxID=3385979 RepID=UPI0039A22B4D
MTTTAVPPPTTRRHAQALRARRSELREALAEVDGRHRARLRGDLALVRLRATADLTASLRDLHALCGPWISGPRTALPPVLGPALDRVCGAVPGRVREEAEAVVRRIAGRMLGPVPLPPEILPCSAHTPSPSGPSPSGPSLSGPSLSGPSLSGPSLSVPSPTVRGLPEPPRRVGRLDALVRAGSGTGVVRLALVLVAGAPALGLSVAGGRTLLPLALGLALAAVVLLARRRRAAVERERWAYWLDTALRDAEAGAAAAVSALLIDLERRSTELLDRIAAQRRGALSAELRALGGPGAP